MTYLFGIIFVLSKIFFSSSQIFAAPDGNFLGSSSNILTELPRFTVSSEPVSNQRFGGFINVGVNAYDILGVNDDVR